MEMKPQTVWASVTVVFMLLASGTTLVILEKDVSIVLTLAAMVAIPVLGAFGAAIYHKLDQVKENSNGMQTKMMQMQQDTQRQLTALAMSMTPPSLPVASSGEDEKLTNDQPPSLLLRPSGELDRN